MQVAVVPVLGKGEGKEIAAKSFGRLDTKKPLSIKRRKAALERLSNTNRTTFTTVPLPFAGIIQFRF